MDTTIPDLMGRAKYVPDPRDIEERMHEAKMVAAGRCPYSGLSLKTDGEGPEGTLSCDVCDCFGFSA